MSTADDPKTAAGLTYESAGVSISAGEEVVSRIKDLARSTFTPDTLSDIGAFGALYRANFPATKSPALVSSADGVGTKLKIAFLTGKHTTVGEDLVNHCINDILVQGARPLFFLDYFATGELEPDVAVDVISGIARACKNTGVAFIGGETAEMPDFYARGEYDLAGFIVGVVDTDRIVDGSQISAGDRVVGIASNGLHTNGYTLARRALFERAGLTTDTHSADLSMTVGQALLKPHTCYLAPITEALCALGENGIHGMAHITGGGIAGNLARVIPDNLQARLERAALPVPPIFALIQRSGNIARDEMYRAFNMGVGYTVVCPHSKTRQLLEILTRHGHTAADMGEIVTRTAVSDPAVTFA
ncbi:MAG TPA: phosphoribosylformylglycinamidine cyclo-ligase [candidate division Zixibacteria bacterium]|nr:phosphoribosylformylglycinamidine cyclo-ligase [candidate division Zixibacteria bacterium]